MRKKTRKSLSDSEGLSAVEPSLVKERDSLEDLAKLLLLNTAVAEALTRGSSLSDMLQRCAEAIVQNLQVCFARIWILNEELELKASAGLYTHLDGKHSRIPVGELKIGRIAKERQAYLTNSLADDPHISNKEWAKNEGICSFAGLPLLVEDRLVGVLAVFSKTELNDDSLSLLRSISGNLAVGIDRKSGEEEIAKLAAIVESSQDAIISKDLSGNILTWNEAAEHIFGYKQEEIVGKSITLLIPEGRIEEEAQILSKLKKGERIKHYETVRKAKNGRLIDVSLTISPILNNSGDIVAASKSIRDISDSKYIEDALREAKYDLEEKVSELAELNSELVRARDEADSASKLKSEFVANMSHEIRTPMNAVIGMCNALLKSNLTQSQLKIALSIKEAGNSLLTVINDILDFSKIEAGKLELDPVEFNLRKTIEGACDLFSLQVRAKNLEIMSYIGPRVPVTVVGDPERLRQVLVNLISNAVKFTEQGSVSVRVSESKCEQGKSYLQFVVSDTGIGIDTDRVNNLFQPFTQADGSVSREYGGTGLGLSISKHLVELMGGDLGVESAVGRGSIFGFTLPLQVVASGSKTQNHMELLHEKALLIVDDEESTRDILERYALDWGLKPETSSTCEQARRALRAADVENRSFDIVLLDLKFPEQSGIELAKEIVESPQENKPKIVVLTGYDDPNLKKELLEIGVSDFLTKPVKQRKLLKSMIQVFSNKLDSSNVSFSGAVPERKGTANKRDDLILVVDDRDLNLEVAKLYLEDFGYTCHFARDGHQALEALSSHSYALVLMDCQMPGMDGFSTARAIREMEEGTGKHVPIVAMTARALKGDRELCIDSGMDDYLSKPLEADRLEQVLVNFLGESSGEEFSSSVEQSDAESEDCDDQPAIDFGSLRDRYNGRERALFEIVSKQVPDQIETIRKAVNSNDLSKLSAELHALEGVMAGICANRAVFTCRLIRDTKNTAIVWPQLEALCSRLALEVEEVLTLIEKDEPR